MPLQRWVLPTAAVLGACLSSTYWLVPLQVYRQKPTMRRGAIPLEPVDEGADCTRFTLRGAYVAMWRMQWPWKDRLMARAEALRQQLLADTRLNG